MQYGNSLQQNTHEKQSAKSIRGIKRKNFSHTGNARIPPSKILSDILIPFIFNVSLLLLMAI